MSDRLQVQEGNKAGFVEHGNYRVSTVAIAAAEHIPEGKYDRVLLATALLRAGWSAPA